MIQTDIFDGPTFVLPIQEESSIDTIKNLEDDREAILNMLGEDRQAFQAWLTSCSKFQFDKNEITMKVLELLVYCWLVSKSNVALIKGISNE